MEARVSVLESRVDGHDDAIADLKKADADMLAELRRQSWWIIGLLTAILMTLLGQLAFS